LRLTQVKSSLFFLEEFNNKDAHGEEEFLRSFDISEEGKWAKMFVKTFMCYESAAEAAAWGATGPATAASRGRPRAAGDAASAIISL
jgi:hypothetical protein